MLWLFGGGWWCVWVWLGGGVLVGVRLIPGVLCICGEPGLSLGDSG